MAVKQRADLTFKHNKTNGRHGWLRLTPAYSLKIVEDILQEYNNIQGLKVLDPFSGTATTPLTASYYGCSATSVEINPFLVWFGRTKVANYSSDDIILANKITKEIVLGIRKGDFSPIDAPPIHNIERWWRKDKLDFLCLLKGAINAMTVGNTKIKDLLSIAFCRLMIELSNAAFNHVSMSFKDVDTNIEQLSIFDEMDNYLEQFQSNVQLVLEGARENPSNEVQIIHGDSRDLSVLLKEKYDLLITSPPYPNRISYIRELRPYMYWLGFLKEAKEAGELDWKSIGGTWGTATSKLASWVKSPDTYFPSYLPPILEKIANSDSKNGLLMANYVAKYFEDIWNHLLSVKQVMNKGSYLHYIVGNSTFYQTLVPVEKIYKDMFSEIGFSKVEIKILRKRNSKKELFEFDVIAKV
jgi:hypothetical protein